LTGDEYSELAALWSAPPRQEEQRELERLARRTPSLARLGQWGELAVGLILAGIISASIVLHLGAATALTGSLILLLLGWSSWKRHHLGNIALLIDGQDRLSFVQSSLRAKEAELNRSALGLALILPGTLLMMLLGFSLREGEANGGALAFLWTVLSTPRGLTAAAFLLCAVLLLSLSHIRLQGELVRLRALRDDYADEVRQDQLPRG
jgi:hypothetical protein